MLVLDLRGRGSPPIAPASLEPFVVTQRRYGAGQGTIPLGNNNPGAITGEYIDGGNVIHGFLVARLVSLSRSGQTGTPNKRA